MKSGPIGRRLPLLVALLMAVAAGAQHGPVAPTSVLLITVDTLRPDALGWVAGRNATPAIDRLAAEGLRFPAAVSPVPLTLPAHVSLLTGLYPPRHGVRDNGHVLGRGAATLAELARQRGLRTAAFVSGYPLRSLFGLGRGFERYDDALPLVGGEWQERAAPETTRAALAWLRTLGNAERFFLWVHYYDAHDPYTPPVRLKRPGPRGDYDGEVAFVDESVQALRQGLRELGRDAGLLTVLTADHGESLGEHGEDTHGFFVYDATTLVPLVLHCPGRVQPGQSTLQPRLVDVLPTIADLAGLATPAGIDGVSLKPTLAGSRQSLPPAYIETLQPWLGYGWAPLSAVRADGYKLIDAPRAEMFDLKRDPGEATNTFAREEHRASRLLALLEPLRMTSVAPTSAADDPEVAERLRALGYVGGGAAPSVTSWPRGLADPKDRLALRERLHAAEQALVRRDYRAALPEFAAVLKEDPGNRFALLRSATVQTRLGRWQQAIAPLQTLVAADPHQAEARYMLGEALMHSGQAQRATQEWLELTRLQPLRSVAWSNLGAALLQSGQADKAVQALEEAVRLEPAEPLFVENLASARYELALRELSAGRPERARELLRVALEGDPSLRRRAAADARLRPLLEEAAR
jgi:choline-sulfatase